HSHHQDHASTNQFPTNKPPTTPNRVYPGGDGTTTQRAWPQPPHTAGWDATRVTAAIAKGKHPVPYRTRKLSLSAPMVLQPRGCGRVGRRRTYTPQRPPIRVASAPFTGPLDQGAPRH